MSSTTSSTKISASAATKRQTVVLATALDDAAPQLVSAAASLCQRAGMNLRLVHVLTNSSFIPGATDYGVGFLDGQTLQILEEQAIASANSRIHELAASIENRVGVSAAVVIQGSVTEGILSEAAAVKASLIICAAGGRHYKLIPSGFSTALSLMANASTPVLVIPAGQTIDFGKSPLTLLVADDLQAAGRLALNAAFLWAKRLGKAAIRHVHVNGMRREDLDTALRDAAAASHAPMTGSFDSEAIYNALQTQIAQKLSARAHEGRQATSESRISYEAAVLTGNVADELQKAAETCDAAMMVFGRHTTLHHKPFAIGNVSYRTMLTQKRPVLVIPKED